MESTRKPFYGIIKGVKGRAILAPTAYILFAYALPIIAFGEQLNRDTTLTVQTL
ncbi:hypothetical protein UlMin_038594 [Ulmus minor]